MPFQPGDVLWAQLRLELGLRLRQHLRVQFLKDRVLFQERVHTWKRRWHCRLPSPPGESSVILCDAPSAPLVGLAHDLLDVRVVFPGAGLSEECFLPRLS